ncbi:hypothetical protein AOX55_00006027 (plasmid) [Sinorhizobium fredii CCBAU 25509]|nr:hypothetical protein AOX55_00006027 [Sinorhizobium fredii CCBAU 25509]
MHAKRRAGNRSNPERPSHIRDTLLPCRRFTGALGKNLPGSSVRCRRRL